MRGLRTRKPPPRERDVGGWATAQFDRRELMEMIGPDVVDDATVHLVVDLALRIGEAQLAGGAGAADITATMLAITEAYGLPQCEVDVIFTSITVCCRRGVEASPVTTTRVVRFRSLDYTRLAALDQLVLRIVRRTLTAGQAYGELDTLLTGERPYPRWVATVAWAAMAASLAVLFGAGFGLFEADSKFFGAGFGLAAVAAAVTALVDRIGRVLNRRSLPFFFQQVVGAGVVTTVSVGLYGLLPPELSPALVLAAGLTVLLSGLSVVGSAQDAITGFYVTAAGRTFEVAMMTTGLVVGVVLALQIGDSVGADITPPVLRAPDLNDLTYQVPAAALTATFFALACYGPPRALLGAGLGGMTSFTVYGLASVTAMGPTAASALGAIVVGFVGRVVSRRLKLPPLVMAVAGIAPLLPGLTTYRGVLELTVHNNPAGVLTLLSAASIGLALAAGVVLGEFLASPVRKGLSHLERRRAGPRLAGPLE